MKLQNEQLRQIIHQLQTNLDTTNDQLAQALETASTVNGLHDEITNLKLQLQKATENGDRTRSTLKSQIIDLTNRAEEERIRLNSQIEKQSKELARAKKSAADNGKERDLLAEELSNVKNELKICLEKNNKLTKIQAKGKDKIQKLNEQLDQLAQKYADLNTAQEQLALENKGQSEKIAALEEEIQKQKSQNASLTDSLKAKSDECTDLHAAIDHLQEQYNVQKDDFEQLSDEREKLFTLVQKLNNATAEYEQEIESLKADNSALAAKAKKATALTARLFEDNFDIKAIKYPFDEELTERINKILAFDHFQSTQKIQLIINECAKDLNKLREDNEALEADNAEKLNDSEEIRSKFTETYNLLLSIMREWKNLECNEQKIDAIAFCTADEGFLKFLAEEGFKLENLNECLKFLGPLFVPQELFEPGEECFERRKALVDKIAEEDKDLATLIAALFLINERLKKQIDVLVDSADQKESINNSLKQLGIENISTAPELFDALQKKLQHLKDTRREIHMALVAARNELNSKTQQEEQYKKQIEDLKSQITNLKNENENLKNSVELYQDRILKDEQDKIDRIKKTVPTTTEKKTNPIKLDTSSSASASVIEAPKTPSVASIASRDSSDEVCQAVKSMQKALQEKVAENEQLRTELAQLKENSQAEIEEMHKKHEKAELVLYNQVHELQDALDATSKKLSQTRKKAKSVVNEMKAQHESDLQCAMKSLNDNQAESAAKINELQEKAEKACVLTKQFQETIGQLDAKIRELDEENISLRRNVTAAENKSQLMQEKFAKEQKSAAAAANVKMLNIETQHQKELKELKQKVEQEKQRAIDFFTSHLGALYGIVDLDFDENSLTRLFSRIQADLNKLKFFQEQATKL